MLELLKKYDLHALFFITGHMAEALSIFPKTTELLNDHQIGYHTSSHSVHPTLFEFTDVQSYNEAYQTSVTRETAHINPLTGEIQGLGGIHSLQDLFPGKKIVSFRAPGYCLSPPHLEALKTFGISYDFSTNLSLDPVSYGGVTFYPFPLFPDDWQGGVRGHLRLQKFIMGRTISVLTIHPSKLVNKLDWDLIYNPKFNAGGPNPQKLAQLPAKNPAEVSCAFNKFELLLKHLKYLQKSHILTVTSHLEQANKILQPTIADIEKCYRLSSKWIAEFGYNPKFLYNHFLKFFKEYSSI
jgi:peptidoglycan/xylan/chitin deacetylase (PgdA/CDA1 family)